MGYMAYRSYCSALHRWLPLRYWNSNPCVLGDCRLNPELVAPYDLASGNHPLIQAHRALSAGIARCNACSSNRRFCPNIREPWFVVPFCCSDPLAVTA